MPFVFVYSWQETLDEIARRAISHGIQINGVRFFGQDTKPALTLADFTVIFVDVGPDDELAKDVIAVYHLHAFPRRIEEGRPDTLAKTIATRLAIVLESLEVKEETSVGVALEHSIMGWGTSSARANDFEGTR